MKRNVLTSFAVLCLLSTVFLIGLAFNVQPVEASGTIYIRTDGSIEGTTDISTVDSVTYTFTDNIFNQSIVVERSNIMIDGAGFTVQGTGSGDGIKLSMLGYSNVTLKNIKVTNFYMGIVLIYSHNNTLIGNTATNNTFGIHLFSSVFNNLSDNIASSNTVRGIFLDYFCDDNVLSGNIASSNGNEGIAIFECNSDNNTLVGNTVANNEFGIYIQCSPKNVLFHNNFINNTFQAKITHERVHTWDNGYPSGGNYWSNYTGVDEKSGPNQDQPGSDGIGDTPYVIDVNNEDSYPLMSPWQPPPERELIASITAPTSLWLGGSSLLNATVANEGSDDEVEVQLELLINDTIADSTTVSLLQAGDSHTLSYLWTPTAEGIYNVTAYALPVSGETSVENNQMSKVIVVSIPPEVGVKAGDWIKCDYSIIGWPSGTPRPEWLKVEIQGVDGTTATVRVTMRMSDGTEQSDTVDVDVVTGGGTFDTLFGFLIPADCSTGDSIIMGGDGLTFNVTIDGEATRTYAGASRTVFHSSFSQYGTQLTYYWDKETGILVEASTSGGGVTAIAKVSETNMWEAAPFWMEWWFYVIVAVAVVALAGAVYVIRRRKAPTTPIPSPEK